MAIWAYIVKKKPQSGVLYAAGSNNYRQLFLGDTIDRSFLVQSSSDNVWVSVSAGNTVTLIRNDSTLWVGGNDDNGALGLGTHGVIVSSPTQIGSETIWASATCETNTTHAITISGVLWSWGQNAFGGLGIGDTISRSSPVQVSGTGWKQVTTSSYSSLAVKTDGTLWALGGYNIYGQLGLGHNGFRSTPTQIGANNNWKQVSISNNSAAAVTTDGNLYTWGYDGNGQLGHNTFNIQTSTPTQVGADTNWSQVSCGSGFMEAVKTDGTLWSWGANDYGQLGTGDRITRSSPVQVGSDTNWQYIQCADQYSVALKSNGTAWAWGYNISGQLAVALPTNQHQSSPVQIGSMVEWSTKFTLHHNTTMLIKY